jgi:hypothetical protein
MGKTTKSITAIAKPTVSDGLHRIIASKWPDGVKQCADFVFLD